MPVINENGVVQHYGVKGMRWGVRRAINKAKRRYRESEAKRHRYRKELLADPKKQRRLLLKGIGQSAVTGGLLTFGANKLLGFGTAESAKAAVVAAQVSAVLGGALNGVALAELHLRGE